MSVCNVCVGKAVELSFMSRHTHTHTHFDLQHRHLSVLQEVKGSWLQAYEIVERIFSANISDTQYKLTFRKVMFLFLFYFILQPSHKTLNH